MSIRDLRLERGLSQREMAEAAGVTEGYYSLIENGKRKPRYPVINRLADALNIDKRIMFEVLDNDAE